MTYPVGVKSDACIGWEEIHGLLDALADAVRRRRLKEGAKTEAEYSLRRALDDPELFSC